jgi:hypothetical protein
MHDWWEAECTKSIDDLPALEAVRNKVGTPFQHNWIFNPVSKKELESRANSTGGSSSSSVLGSQKLLNTSDISRQLLQLKNPASIFEDRMLNGVIIGVSLTMLMFYTTKLLGISL